VSTAAMTLEACHSSEIKLYILKN